MMTRVTPLELLVEQRAQVKILPTGFAVDHAQHHDDIDVSTSNTTQPERGAAHSEMGLSRIWKSGQDITVTIN
jgi:hypothetical protein